MSNQPKFADRVRAMHAVADNLVSTANLLTKYVEEVKTEALHMDAAQRRFEERAPKNRKAGR